jgi:hypothetical protein
MRKVKHDKLTVFFAIFRMRLKAYLIIRIVGVKPVKFLFKDPNSNRFSQFFKRSATHSNKEAILSRTCNASWRHQNYCTKLNTIFMRWKAQLKKTDFIWNEKKIQREVQNIMQHTNALRLKKQSHSERCGTSPICRYIYVAYIKLCPL